MSSIRPDITTHPSHHLISTLPSKTFDVVVLGGGPTGLTAATRVTAAGLSALVVESELAGGECQNWACVPSKALLRPLEVYADAEAVGGMREVVAAAAVGAGQNAVQGKGGDGAGAAKGGSVNLGGLWAFRDDATFRWRDEGTAAAMEAAGVTFVHGMGSLSGEKKVKIVDWQSKEEVEVQAGYVCIATGSEPVVPDVKGIQEVGYWTPREAVSAREVPEHLVILGAGPVGCEFATIYAKLGSHVTLITPRPQVLPTIHPHAASIIHASLTALSVTILTSTRATAITTTTSSSSSTPLSITLSTSNPSTALQASHLLLATGRVPRTSTLNLPPSIAPRANIPVDAHLRATALGEHSWLYCLGDTNGIGNTTHMGMYEATIAAAHIIATHTGTPNPHGLDTTLPHLRRTVPQTVFTHPPVASVGVVTAEAATAAELGETVEIAVNTGGGGTHSYLYAEGYVGWACWRVERETGRIVGAVFVGMGVANGLLHASALAIVKGVRWWEMGHVVPCFPTLGEAYHLLVGRGVEMSL